MDDATPSLPPGQVQCIHVCQVANKPGLDIVLWTQVQYKPRLEFGLWIETYTMQTQTGYWTLDTDTMQT